MAQGTELTGRLTIDLSGFLAMLQRGLDQGTAAVNKWAAGSGKVKIDIDTTNAKKGLDELANAGRSLQDTLGSIGAAVGLGSLAAGIGSVAKAMIDGNAEMEQYNTSFEVLTGSVENAQGLLGEMKTFAANTPFEFPDLAQASQTLLSFGIAQKDIIPTLKQLGDVSGGNKEKLKSLALVFGQVASNGKLMGGDLLQMINVGFNPLQVISTKTGKSMATLRKEMEKGQISIDMVKDAFATATGPGGQFSGMLEKQSKTFTGLMSTLQDNIGSAIRELGGPLFDAAKNILSGLVGILSSEGFQGVIQSIVEFLRSGLGQAVAIFGSIVAAGGGLVALFTTLAPLLPALTAGFTAFWSAATGPVGIAVAAVAAFAAGLFYLYNNVKPFRDAIDSAFATLKRFVSQIVDAVMPTLRKLGEVASAVGGFLSEYLALGFKIVYKAIETTLSIAGKVVSVLVSFVGKLFGIKDAGKAAGGALEFINRALDTAVLFFQRATAIVEGLSAAFDSFVATLSEVGNIIANLSFDNLSASLDKLLNIFSDAGEDAGDAFAAGFTAKIQDEKLAKEFTDGFKKIDAALTSTLNALGADAKPEAINAAINKAQQDLGTLARNLSAGMKVLPEGFNDAITEAIDILKEKRPKIEEATKVPPPTVDTGAAEKEAERLADIEAKIQALKSARLIAAEADTRRRELLALKETGKQRLAEIQKQIDKEKSARVKSALSRLLAAQQEENARLESEKLEELAAKGAEDFRKRTEEATAKQIEALKQQEEAIIGNDEDSIRRRSELRQQQISLALDTELSIIASKTPEFSAVFAELDRQFLAGTLDAGAYSERVATALAGATANVGVFKQELDDLSALLLNGTIDPEEYERRMTEAMTRAVAAAGGAGDVAAAIARAGNAALETVSAEEKRRREKQRADEDRALASIANKAKRQLAQAELDAKRARDATLDSLEFAERVTRELAAAGAIGAEEAASRQADIAAERVALEIRTARAIYDAQYQYQTETNDFVAASHALRVGLTEAFTAKESEEEKNRRRERRESAQSELQTLKEKHAAGLLTLKEYNAQSGALIRELSENTEREVSRWPEIIGRIQTAVGSSLSALAERFRSTFSQVSDKFIAGAGKLGDVLLSSSQYFGAVVAQAAIEQEDILQAALKAVGTLVFDFLQKMVPVWSAQIFGFTITSPDSIATLGVAGVAKWLAFTAILQGLVAGARGILNLAGGTDWIPGRYVPGRDTVPIMGQPGEAMIQRDMNAKHHDLVKMIRRDDPALQHIRRAIREPRGFSYPISSGHVTDNQLREVAHVAAMAHQASIATRDTLSQWMVQASAELSQIKAATRDVATTNEAMNSRDKKRSRKRPLRRVF